ncbi:hypothetical protein M141_2591 [Bacteroides fragilis str. S38L5]|nr:hypothetical protein M106_1861 [Bacteroides fragilis str. 1009-4-F \
MQRYFSGKSFEAFDKMSQDAISVFDALQSLQSLVYPT